MSRLSNFEGKFGKKVSQAFKKSSHKFVGSLIQFLMDLGSNMAGFWRGLGGQVGAMLGPNATKTGFKNQSQKSSLFGRLLAPILMNFWWILAPTWGGQGGPTNQFFSDYVGSWSQDAPRPLQDPSKSPTRGPKSPQEPNFGRILEDFWLIFVRILIDF